MASAPARTVVIEINSLSREKSSTRQDEGPTQRAGSRGIVPRADFEP